MEEKIKTFEKFHEILVKSGVSPTYIVLEKGKKTPYTPKGKHFQVTFEEAKKFIEQGYNIGIYGGENHVIVDLDLTFKNHTTPENRNELLDKWLPKFPPTLTVKTRSGGYHFYYLTEQKVSGAAILHSSPQTADIL